ncbi:hypothetical protein V8C86DRAFT_2551342, partial [Haematococcus lacustris]
GTAAASPTGCCSPGSKQLQCRLKSIATGSCWQVAPYPTPALTTLITGSSRSNNNQIAPPTTSSSMQPPPLPSPFTPALLPGVRPVPWTSTGAAAPRQPACRPGPGQWQRRACTAPPQPTTRLDQTRSCTGHCLMTRSLGSAGLVARDRQLKAARSTTRLGQAGPVRGRWLVPRHCNTAQGRDSSTGVALAAWASQVQRQAARLKWPGQVVMQPTPASLLPWSSSSQARSAGSGAKVAAAPLLTRVVTGLGRRSGAWALLLPWPPPLPPSVLPSAQQPRLQHCPPQLTQPRPPH